MYTVNVSLLSLCVVFGIGLGRSFCFDARCPFSAAGYCVGSLGQEWAHFYRNVAYLYRNDGSASNLRAEIAVQAILGMGIFILKGGIFN